MERTKNMEKKLKEHFRITLVALRWGQMDAHRDLTCEN